MCKIAECTETNKGNIQTILEKVCEQGVKIDNLDCNCTGDCDCGEGQTINVNVTCNGGGDEGEGPIGNGTEPCEDCNCTTECPPGVIPENPCDTSGNLFETEGDNLDEYMFT